MDAPPPDFRLLHVQMAPVPPHQRLEFWRDLLARKLFAVDIEPLRDETYRVEASLRMLPNLTIGWGLIDASINRRTPRLVASDNDDFFLTINMENTLGAEQDGREITLRAGDAYIMACAEVGSFHRATPGRIMCLRVPSHALSARVPNLYDRIVLPIPRHSEALRLLAGYARAVGEQPLHSTELRAVVTRHVHDLVAMVLNPSNDAAAAGAAGLRAARLMLIKSYVCANLGHHGLSIGMVADHQKLSPRQVQRLFEDEGTTFSEFTLFKRLERVRGILADPAQRHRTISDIAYDNGFGDISHFNRVFRRRFGAAPSDLRARA